MPSFHANASYCHSRGLDHRVVVTDEKEFLEKAI